MNAIQIDLGVIFLALLRVGLPAAMLLLFGSWLDGRGKAGRKP